MSLTPETAVRFLSVLLGYMRFLLTVVVAVFLSVLALDILMSTGVVERLSHRLKALARAAGMPDELSVIPVSMSLGSHVGHSLLASLLREKRISEGHVIACVLVASPFLAVHMTLRYYLPIVFPALGLYAATVYLLLLMLGSLVRMSIGIAYSRFFLREWGSADVTTGPKGGATLSVRRSLASAAAMARQVAVRSMVVIVVLSLLHSLGVFDLLRPVLGSAASAMGLGPRGALIAATHAISPMGGVLMAGAMLSSGEVCVRDALVSLFVGNILFSLAFDFTRHTFPYYAMFYPVRLASKLTLIGMVMTVATSLLSILVVLLCL